MNAPLGMKAICVQCALMDTLAPLFIVYKSRYASNVGRMSLEVWFSLCHT